MLKKLNMEYVDIVFTINVHEKLSFLRKQLDNIQKYVLVEYVVILNANDLMYNEILKSDLLEKHKNVKLYPKFIKKKTFDGSLSKGIFLNMEFALNNYKFKYFVILSSRNLFYNQLNKENYNTLLKIHDKKTFKSINIHEWHWYRFFQTKLAKYVIQNNMFFGYGHHEGLTFDYVVSKQIVDFLNANEIIKDDLFNFNWCVEEFAFQSIALMFQDYYYQIGNWPSTRGSHDHIIHELPKDRYVFKTIRK